MVRSAGFVGLSFFMVSFRAFMVRIGASEILEWVGESRRLEWWCTARGALGFGLLLGFRVSGLSCCDWFKVRLPLRLGFRFTA